jgi:hypothetical protein
MNKKLAKKGRFGDTKIRKVDGKPAHVNSQEAKLIDRKGKLGEILVKAEGAGTINPKTGLKEYHKSSRLHNSSHKIFGDNIAHSNISTLPGNLYDNASDTMEDAIELTEGNEAELGALAYFLVTGDIAGALKVGYTMSQVRDKAEELKLKGEIAEDKYQKAMDYYERQDDYLGEVYGSQKEAYDRLWGENGYYAQVFGSQMETYNKLKEAYTEQLGYSPTEKEMVSRFQDMIKNGDPELQKILDEKTKLALSGIRQQGAENIQRVQGTVIGQGLENSIVAQDIMARTDEATLKQLSETARKIATENRNAQLGVKRQAQSDLDRLNLSVEGRKRTAITNLAGLSTPIQSVAPAEPVRGIPGIAPTNQSGLYDQNPWSQLFSYTNLLDFDNLFGQGETPYVPIDPNTPTDR